MVALDAHVGRDRHLRYYYTDGVTHGLPHYCAHTVRLEIVRVNGQNRVTVFDSTLTGAFGDKRVFVKYE